MRPRPRFRSRLVGLWRRRVGLRGRRGRYMGRRRGGESDMSWCGLGLAVWVEIPELAGSLDGCEVDRV